MRILTEFLGDWRTTGAVAATSRFTQRKMLDEIDWTRARVVVELGPGSGSVTRAILGRLGPRTRFLAVEINDRFVHSLRREIVDPRFHVVHGSAADLPRLLTEQGVAAADAIFSTLPLSTLEPALRGAIVEAAGASLSPHGRLTWVQYQPFVLPPLLRAHVGDFHLRMCVLNLPPAFIYTCARVSASVGGASGPEAASD